jgi:hypothetical protein
VINAGGAGHGYTRHDPVLDGRRCRSKPNCKSRSFIPAVRGASTALQARGYPVERAGDVRSDLAYDRRNREGNTRDEQTVLGGRRTSRSKANHRSSAFISIVPFVGRVSIARFVEAR